MKYIGIDFGLRRVGIAVSDDTGKLAFPHSVIPNNENLLREIEKIIEEEKIGSIVMGESKNFAGEPNKIMAEINGFKKILEEKIKLPILFESEFMTSAQAEKGIRSRRPDTHSVRGSGSRLKHRDKNKMNDASAAAIILQSYLDKNSHVL